MYGTVARFRIKPGAEEQFTQLTRGYEEMKIPGYIATYVYRMDADSRNCYMAVLFASKAAYDANADSPEQDARYRQMVALLDGEPEWHDGEVIYAGPSS